MSYNSVYRQNKKALNTLKRNLNTIVTKNKRAVYRALNRVGAKTLTENRKAMRRIAYYKAGTVKRREKPPQKAYDGNFTYTMTYVTDKRPLVTSMIKVSFNKRKGEMKYNWFDKRYTTKGFKIGKNGIHLGVRNRKEKSGKNSFFGGKIKFKRSNKVRVYTSKKGYSWKYKQGSAVAVTGPGIHQVLQNEDFTTNMNKFVAEQFKIILEKEIERVRVRNV